MLITEALDPVNSIFCDSEKSLAASVEWLTRHHLNHQFVSV